MKDNTTFFAPKLFLKQLAPAIEFYKKAFDAIVLRQWNNDDGSVHVAEMSIDGALYHMHEETKRINALSPETLKGTSILLGLFVDDPHKVMAKAQAAGGTEIDPIQDYDYGYQQGTLADPFGHQWVLQKKIG